MEDKSNFDVNEFLSRDFSKKEEVVNNPQNSNVSVGEKEVPKSKNEDSTKIAFTPEEILKSEMYVKLNGITEENFNEKIIDLQLFFTKHKEMLMSDFKPELARRLKNADDEYRKINAEIRNKRSDDSLIMKGEIEVLEVKYHKVGKEIRVLTKIRNSF